MEGSDLGQHLATSPLSSSTAVCLREVSMRSRLLTLALGLALGASPLIADGAPLIIHESADLGPSGTGGGVTISLNQFVGTSFSIAEAVRVTTIGGDMGTSPGGVIFGAIVPVPSAGAVPSVAPLEIESIALAHTVFSAAAGHPTTMDFRTPLAVDLAPGNYALIFGSGLFGANGQGFLGTNNIPFPDSVAFTTDNAPPPPGFPLGRWNSGFFGTNLRLVVEGKVLRRLTSLAPSILWIGLKNSDDQGTQFDLRTEVSINDELVSYGITRCITGVTRTPSKAKTITVPFGPITDLALEPGDTLSFTVLTRIGTSSDDAKCPGHSNAVGLRLYYDSIRYPARFGAELVPDPLADFFLHSDTFLDDVAPTARIPNFQDSPSLTFSGGNPWREIGTWNMSLSDP